MSVVIKPSDGAPTVRAYGSNDKWQYTREDALVGDVTGSSDETNGDTVVQADQISSESQVTTLRSEIPSSEPISAVNNTPSVIDVTYPVPSEIKIASKAGQDGERAELILGNSKQAKEKLVYEIDLDTDERRRAKSLVSGSIIRAMTDYTLPLADGWENNTNYYTEQDISADLNPNCWLASLDLRAKAMDTSGSGWGKRGGTLITPRHAVFARHTGSTKGLTLYFHGGQSATVIGYGVGDGGYTECDIAIGTLDTAIVAPISPFKIPSEMGNRIANPLSYNYLHQYGNGGLGFSYLYNQAGWFPERIRYTRDPLYLDQPERNWNVDGVNYGQYMSNSYFQWFDLREEYQAIWWPHEGTPYPIGGDSGGPICFTVDGEVLLYSTYYGTGNGPNFSGAKPLVDALIAVADTDAGVTTGLTCTEYNISSYPEYTP